MDDLKLLTKVLDKYVDIKMFKKEQDAFKEEFFEALFEPTEPVDYTNRSTLFINAVFEEDELPYLFFCNKEENGLHKGEWYWILRDLDKL
jgi:hypothetical protein